MPHVKINGIDIFHEIVGTGPAMLLIHGLGNDLREWAPTIEILKDRFTLIAYDMRGSGRSAKPAGPYTMDMMAADAAELVREVATPPVSVMGFSMGGCVALKLALERPDLVNKLVLVSTLPSWKGPMGPSDDVDALFHRTDVSEGLLVEVYETIFGAAYRGRVSAEDYVAQRMDDEYPQTADSYLGQLAALEGFDVRERVGRIESQTIIVVGTDDMVVPPENSRWLAENIPHARLETIEGAGHMLPVECPAEFTSCLAKRCTSLLN